MFAWSQDKLPGSFTNDVRDSQKHIRDDLVGRGVISMNAESTASWGPNGRGYYVTLEPGVLTDTNKKIEDWAGAHNPFFVGDSSNLLSLIPFVALIVLLYLTGREQILTSRTRAD